MKVNRAFLKIGCLCAAGVTGLLGSETASAQSLYSWNVTTGNWSVAGNWTPAGGPPGAADSITYTFNDATTRTLNVETSRTIDAISKPGSARWDILNNGASPAVLTANSITGTTTNFIIRNGTGGLSVVVGSLNIGGGSTFFGSTSNGAGQPILGVTVTGTTTVSAGALNMNVQNSSTNSYSLGVLDVGAAGTVRLANRPRVGSTAAIANVSGITGSGIIEAALGTSTNSNQDANLVITNTANFSSSALLRDQQGTQVPAGVLQVTKNGTGTQTLTGANTYSGGTTINEGVLQVNNNGNLGAAAGTLTFGGGTLAVASGTTTVARSTTLNSQGGTIRLNSNNSLVTWSGTISGAGGLTKTGTAATQSVLYLTATNTYTGGTVLESGILRINEDANLGATSGTLTFNNGSNTARLITTFSMTTSRSVVLNGNGVIATEQLAPETPNVTAWNGIISGTGSLEKRFAGTLVLNAANTYTGATTVTTGSLLVNGSLASSGVTVAAGTLLGGSGTIAGEVTVAGTISPGNSPGTLTINNSLTLNDTAVAQMELSGTAAGLFDQIALTGALTLDGTIAVSLIDGFDPIMGDSFTLFTGWSGSIIDNGFVFDFTNAALDPGLSWDTSDFLATGAISVVPEPAASALLGLGLMVIAWRARIRKHSQA